MGDTVVGKMWVVLVAEMAPVMIDDPGPWRTQLLSAIFVHERIKVEQAVLLNEMSHLEKYEAVMVEEQAVVGVLVRSGISKKMGKPGNARIPEVESYL